MTTVSITDQLKILVDLQELDAQIYDQNRVLALKPEEEARLRAAFQQASEGAKAAEAQHKVLEVKRNQREMDLGQKDAQIKKLQGQLFQVKTNKEYSAMQKEIEGFKADSSVVEEEVLKLMEEIDRIKARLAVEKEALKVQEGALSVTLGKISQEKKALEEQVRQLRSAREVLTPKVDPKILSRYERILENKSGLALVPVRADACGGCHMALPPQLINEVYLAGRLVLCESCARILYSEPPE